jgi:asparagine synthase (glutamine-hydrolysing)
MRRLSIIDVNGGQQPQTDEHQRLQVIQNGEIYNFRMLRRDLIGLGHVFRSQSDTEVLVHGYEEWGLALFPRLNGMFAVAIWDSHTREIVLARDHIGIKPLYYTTAPGPLVFGSELKPVIVLHGATPPVDPQSFRLYLRYGYVPDPFSIFSGIVKLAPGHIVTAALDGRRRNLCYWDPVAMASQPVRSLSSEEAEDVVDEALSRAVSRQMVSDVPLGAFLSGGVDSSTVVAMMQKVAERPTKTYAIGFRERRFDESGWARRVAQHLGTSHSEWVVTPEDALGVIPRLPEFYDEPFADQSAIPTYLVSQLAKTGVTVSLSGDGGDEVFGGYDRYQVLNRMSQWWQLPPGLRRVAVAGGGQLPGSVGRTARIRSDTLLAPSLSRAYRNAVAVNKDRILPQLLSVASSLDQRDPIWPDDLFQRYPFDEAMSLTDMCTYLPGDILTKVDRASMAHSLEARVPILDREFMDTALSIPFPMRRGNGLKELLKRVLSRYLPNDLIERPKQGFGVPTGDWLRGELQPLLTDLLDPRTLRIEGFVDERAVSNLVEEHVRGRRNWEYTLWSLLVFQLWKRQYSISDLADIEVPIAVDHRVGGLGRYG